jgi:hypothetical protein
MFKGDVFEGEGEEGKEDEDEDEEEAEEEDTGRVVREGEPVLSGHWWVLRNVCSGMRS